MSLEAKLQEMHDGVMTVVASQKDFEEKWDIRAKEQDERLTSLEKNIKLSLANKYGVDEKIPKKQWSWARYCYGVCTNDWSGAQFEREECEKHFETRKKQMHAGDFVGGGALVPPQYIAELVSFLRAEMITQRLGVRLMTGLTGSPVMIPKLTSGATANWTAPESTTIASSEQKTGRLEMQPHKLAALVKMSRELVTLSNPAVEAGVRADITLALAEGLDTAFFQGTGVNGQPVGVSNWVPAIQDAGGTWTGAFDGSSTDYDDLKILKDCRKKLGESNALRGRIAWAVNVTSWEAIDRIADADRRPYLVIDPGQGLRGQLLGFPIFGSTLVAPSSGTGLNVVYLGNWDDTILAIWQQVNIEASTQADTAFANDELWIKATVLADVGIRREVSICKQDAVD